MSGTLRLLGSAILGILVGCGPDENVPPLADGPVAPDASPSPDGAVVPVTLRWVWLSAGGCSGDVVCPDSPACGAVECACGAAPAVLECCASTVGVDEGAVAGLLETYARCAVERDAGGITITCDWADGAPVHMAGAGGPVIAGEAFPGADDASCTWTP